MTDFAEYVAPFEAVCADPYGPGREAAAEGRKVAGHMCTYTPEELFHAAGYQPLRIFGRNSGATTEADAHLPAFACGFIRSVLDMGLSGELDFLNLMVFSHTCDTMQNLAGIWKRAVPGSAAVTLTTPVTVGTETSIDYFKQEIARARAALEAMGSPAPDAGILESISLYNEHRDWMRRLYAARRANPNAITGREMMAAVLSSCLMAREEHLPHLQSLVEAVENAEVREADRPKVFVVGNMCQNLDYVAAIENAGCLVLEEDLCSGARAFAMEAVDASDPVEQLARMYLTTAACPTKHQPDFDMAGSLRDKAQAISADGVLILLTKFCDPWCFEVPNLKKVFEDAGLPALLVEVESHQPPAEQFRGRVEAFVEMLEGVK